jgi:hypothetical protein
VYVQLTFNTGVIYGGLLTPRPGRFTLAKDPVPTAQEAVRAVWTAAKYLVPDGVRTPNCITRSAYAIPSHKEEFKGKTKHEGIWGNCGVFDLKYKY